jgi:Mlc titration factor MtfA (ptsG expression regulator)
MMQRLREWLRRRNAAIIALDVTPEQWAQSEERLPFLAHLDDAERQHLRELSLEFLAEKQMSGARGLELNLDMQLSIALQACLLVLKLGLDWYRGWIGIIVYPGDFVIPRQEMDEDGVVHEFDDNVMGEAWLGGPVLLSWHETPEEADGINVVIHEFAHKLDMKNGIPDGLPPLHEGMSRRDWSEAFSAAYDNFCIRVDGGEDTPLDPYAADAPAEFFAVMSEAFFETPRLLHDEYPAVFEQLRLFYRQDPLIHQSMSRCDQLHDFSFRPD